MVGKNGRFPVFYFSNHFVFVSFQSIYIDYRTALSAPRKKNIYFLFFLSWQLIKLIYVFVFQRFYRCILCIFSLLFTVYLFGDIVYDRMFDPL